MESQPHREIFSDSSSVQKARGPSFPSAQCLSSSATIAVDQPAELYPISVLSGVYVEGRHSVMLWWWRGVLGDDGSRYEDRYEDLLVAMRLANDGCECGCREERFVCVRMT